MSPGWEEQFKWWYGPLLHEDFSLPFLQYTRGREENVSDIVWPRVGEGCREWWLGGCQILQYEILSYAHYRMTLHVTSWGLKERATDSLRGLSALMNMNKIEYVLEAALVSDRLSPKKTPMSVYMTEFHKYVVILPHISTFREFKVWERGGKKV